MPDWADKDGVVRDKKPLLLAVARSSQMHERVMPGFDL
jgi:hypothetical protein